MWGDDERSGALFSYVHLEARVPKRVHTTSRDIEKAGARSIKHQLTIAKLPLAKDVSRRFAFTDTQINDALVRDLAHCSLSTAQLPRFCSHERSRYKN